VFALRNKPNFSFYADHAILHYKLCLLPYSYFEPADKSLLYIKVVLNLLWTFYDHETCALPGYYAAKIVIASARCVITRKSAVIIHFAVWNHAFPWNYVHVNS